MRKNIVPPDLRKAQPGPSHTLKEYLLGVAFLAGLLTGLGLIAVNVEIVAHQLPVGFFVILLACLPGFFYFRSRNIKRIKYETLNQALASEFILHADDKNKKL